MTSLEVAAHLPRLRRHARFLCRNAADADDLVQETLVKAMARAELFRPGSTLRPWLFAILHNTFVSSTRAYACQQRLAAIVEDAAIRHQQAAQEARIDLQETLKALDRLPEEQRQVILLVSVESMTTEQAAAVLGLPVGTVRSRLARGRDGLRRLTRRDVPKTPALRLVGGPDVPND